MIRQKGWWCITPQTNVNVRLLWYKVDDSQGAGDERKQREVKEWEWRRGDWVGRGGGLMCPSWGEAGQKWLSVELNWLHYESSAAESISDIIHPSWTASFNPQRVDGRGLLAGLGWGMFVDVGKRACETMGKLCLQLKNMCNSILIQMCLEPITKVQYWVHIKVNMGACVRIDPAPLLNCWVWD